MEIMAESGDCDGARRPTHAPLAKASSVEMAFVRDRLGKVGPSGMGYSAVADHSELLIVSSRGATRRFAPLWCVIYVSLFRERSNGYAPN
jgi:hypothetical protein